MSVEARRGRDRGRAVVAEGGGAVGAFCFEAQRGHGRCARGLPGQDVLVVLLYTYLHVYNYFEEFLARDGYIFFLHLSYIFFLHLEM